MATWNKRALTALKFAISALLVYFIYTKVNIDEIIGILRKTDFFYLCLAVLLFILSKIISAFRLNLYFHVIPVPLSQKSNLRLYLLGMFYNLFLPGGIGGDAYKGYLIKNKFAIKTKKVVSALVLDRLSGLLLLLLYTCLFAFFLDSAAIRSYKPFFVLAFVGSVVLFWLVNKRFFPFLLPIYWKSFLLSAGVQITQVACAYSILLALSIKADTLAYLVIFLLSSIVSVLPLTIGGIGSREVTFYYGAAFLGLNANSSIGISMVFFLITAFVSLLGIYYHFKKIILETEP